MAWTNNDYRAYPAHIPANHRLAAASSPEPISAGAWKTYAEALSHATLYRKYRYLVKANPGLDFSLDDLIANYSFRSRLVSNAFGDWSLLLSAKPKTLADLLDHNPDLAGILSPACQ